MRNVCANVSAMLMVLLLVPVVQAQENLLEQRWYRLESPHFILVSQLSSSQTRRFVEQLEAWRQVTAQLAAGVDSFPVANVPNYVFLFDDEAALGHFVAGQERAFFYGTPRANFMAVVHDESASLREGLHHYSHFLLRNFSDLRLPRWYEEGLSGYLSRMQMERREPYFEPFGSDYHEGILALSETLSMERLLFRDEALASPRLIQIANMKSETLMRYLRHGFEDGYPDRRQQLQSYLRLILEDRTQRFAFDQSFDVTINELDAEFHDYLAGGSYSADNIPFRPVTDLDLPDVQQLDIDQLALLLGELALNSGQAANAQLFFASAMAENPNLARAHSGMGDALRFQDEEGRDQEIAAYFDTAMELAPQDPDILLDYGEYWESELADCDKTYPDAERLMIIERIKQSFTQALNLTPDNAEAHLAMGQVYLFPEESWNAGASHQQRAFELLPADSFIMEQAAKYAIEAQSFEEAQKLIDEMAQPLHFFGVPNYVNDLRQRLRNRQSNEPYDSCAE